MNFTSDEEKLAFKQQVRETCIAILEQRMGNALTAMQQAQESANTEEKSSAGDKHETSRAMSQLDTEMNARQLAQAQRELETIEKLNTSIIFDKMVPGAIAIAGNDLFFIGAGLGLLAIGTLQVIALSAQAPLAAQLIGKKQGDQFSFKGRTLMLDAIF
jgi:transcription elongation GreA/GreB family factor